MKRILVSITLSLLFSLICMIVLSLIGYLIGDAIPRSVFASGLVGFFIPTSVTAWEFFDYL